jgi:hypothetical protein
MNDLSKIKDAILKDDLAKQVADDPLIVERLKVCGECPFAETGVCSSFHNCNGSPCVGKWLRAVVYGTSCKFLAFNLDKDGNRVFITIQKPQQKETTKGVIMASQTSDLTSYPTEAGLYWASVRFPAGSGVGSRQSLEMAPAALQAAETEKAAAAATEYNAIIRQYGVSPYMNFEVFLVGPQNQALNRAARPWVIQDVIAFGPKIEASSSEQSEISKPTL